MNTQQEQVFEVAETILEQLKQSKVNGFPFFAYTGINDFVMLEDELMLKARKNAKGYESVSVVYDYGQDLYNIVFRKCSVPLKTIEGVFFDQMAEIIARELGIL